MANLSLAALFLIACIGSFGNVQAYYSSGGDFFDEDPPARPPTNWLTDTPRRWSTKQPTEEPTIWPTGRPTKEPTVWPTDTPTKWPTVPPTPEPSLSPTENPATEEKYPPTEEKSPESPTSGPTPRIPPPLVRVQKCPGSLEGFVDIDPKATLQYALVPSNPPGSGNGLLCGRLEVENDGGWVGLAFSNEGKMLGSEAIIGIPDDNTVLKYDLAGKGPGGVSAMSKEKQTLRDTSINQVGGKIIMEFAKLLIEEGEIPVLEEGLNNFLHARGGSSLGFHRNGHRSFTKDFSGSQYAGVSAGGDSPAGYGQSQTCPDLRNGIKIDSDAILLYALVSSDPPGSGNGLLCGRLEVEYDEENGGGWVGLAFSDDEKMVGSEAIIGIPDENTVLKYDLAGKGRGGVAAMLDEKQTLRGTSIDQSGGKIIMEFTKLLIEEGEISVLEEGLNKFLYARGGSSLGYHGDRYVSFTKDFAEDPDIAENKAAGKSPTEVTDVVPSPVEESATGPSLPAKDCRAEFCDFVLDPEYKLRYLMNVPEDSHLQTCEGCTLSMELIHESEAWVAIAFSEDGRMIGSEAVIGIPGEGSVLKYNMGGKATASVEPMPQNQQTLLDASIEVKDGQTIMRFTKIMREPGEIEILAAGDNNFLGAYGRSSTLSTHLDRQSVVLNLSSGISVEISTPNKAAWLAHGAIAFLAWGVFVPFAVQSSLLRSLLPEGPIWFKLHRAFNATAFSLFVLAFSISVVATGGEGGNHFGNSHAKMGLAMLILATMQVFGGMVRPDLPAPSSSKNKSKLRKNWEIGHRIIGVVLLACAFWQMGKGIELYALKYSLRESDEGNLATLYWVWVAVMSSIIMAGGVYFGHCKSRGEDTKHKGKGGRSQ